MDREGPKRKTVPGAGPRGDLFAMVGAECSLAVKLQWAIECASAVQALHGHKPPARRGRSAGPTPSEPSRNATPCLKSTGIHHQPQCNADRLLFNSKETPGRGVGGSVGPGPDPWRGGAWSGGPVRVSPQSAGKYLGGCPQTVWGVTVPSLSGAGARQGWGDPLRAFKEV